MFASFCLGAAQDTTGIWKKYDDAQVLLADDPGERLLSMSI